MGMSDTTNEQTLGELLQLISERAGKRKIVLPTQQNRVLALLAEGKTNREIAEMLALSPKTVINYVRIIFQKLGFTRRVQAAAYFLRNNPQVDQAGSQWFK